MFSTRWATKSYFLLNCWQNQLQTAATVGKFGQVAIGKDFPKWRNESSQIVSYRSCCQQQLFKAHQLYIHHWNSVSLTWLSNHASCTASFAFFLRQHIKQGARTAIWEFQSTVQVPENVAPHHFPVLWQWEDFVQCLVPTMLGWENQP